MTDPVVAAEIVPQPDRAQSAARALQQLGFQVFHVGSTISVQAPARVWEDVFHVSFVQKREDRLAISPGSSVERAVPQGPAQIPPSLSELISEVLFVQPPELY
jgi:hypothetical protein